jgi:putative membrane protein
MRIIEPLLWRPLHWCRLEVDVAGGLGHDHPEGFGAVRKALLPVGTQDEARRLLAVIVRGGDPPGTPRYPEAPFPRHGALGALPATGGWPALTKPPRRARWKVPLSYHFLAAGHDGTLAVAVTGRVRRETTLVPLAKTQSVRLVQGPLQRWLGLATVHLDAAGKRVRAEFRERQQEQARSLVGELAALSRSARRQASLAAADRPAPPLGAAPPSGSGPGPTIRSGGHDTAVGPVTEEPGRQAPGGSGGSLPRTSTAGQAASVVSPVNASQSEA